MCKHGQPRTCLGASIRSGPIRVTGNSRGAQLLLPLPWLLGKICTPVPRATQQGSDNAAMWHPTSHESGRARALRSRRASHRTAPSLDSPSRFRPKHSRLGESCDNRSGRARALRSRRASHRTARAIPLQCRPAPGKNEQPRNCRTPLALFDCSTTADRFRKPLLSLALRSISARGKTRPPRPENGL